MVALVEKKETCFGLVKLAAQTPHIPYEERQNTTGLRPPAPRLRPPAAHLDRHEAGTVTPLGDTVPADGRGQKRSGGTESGAPLLFLF